MGESATLRRETGYQTSERKGRKALAPSQTESHVEQVAMDSESKGAYVRVVMENRPTLANACHKQAQAGPKMGKVLGPYISMRVWYPPVRRPGAKHHPKVTQNGHSERSNPTVALRRKLEQGTTRKRCREGWPKKRMPGVMSRIC
jgi:hypothetical protein